MSEAKHTAGPWTAVADCIMRQGNYRDMIVAHTKGDTEAQADANAAHIVRCVNAHEALVGALAEAQRRLDWIARIEESRARIVPCATSKEVAETIREAEMEARAAHALAQKGS